MGLQLMIIRLKSYFACVFQNEETESIPNFDDRNFMKELNTVIISSDKISKAIDRLKSSKSQGPDNIHPMLLKECKPMDQWSSKRSPDIVAF